MSLDDLKGVCNSPNMWELIGYTRSGVSIQILWERQGIYWKICGIRPFETSDDKFDCYATLSALFFRLNRTYLTHARAEAVEDQMTALELSDFIQLFDRPRMTNKRRVKSVRRFNFDTNLALGWLSLRSWYVGAAAGESTVPWF